MKVLKRDDLRIRLKRGEIAPVYVLFGAEDFLRDEAVKAIANVVFGSAGFRDFNETEFSLSVPGNLKVALAAAEQLPMMAPKRVVRIRDVCVSSTASKDTLKEEDETILLDYLSRPAETAVVIIIADELNGVRKLGRLLRERTVAVEFEKLKDAELLQRAGEKISALGAKIDDAALRHLVALVGPDVRRLTNEIQKLATAALPDGVIDFELVDSLVPHSREIGNFELADHLLAGDTKAAIWALRKALDGGAEPVMVLGALSYSFRRLLIVKELMEQGARREDAARVINMRYSSQEQFFTAARRADSSQLVRALERLAEVDLALKTSLGGGGPQGGRVLIETLLCELGL